MARKRRSDAVDIVPHPLVAAHRRYARAAGFAEKTTITDRVELLNRIVRDLGDPLTITSTQLVDWFAALGLKRWSLHTYYCHAAGFFRWLHEFGHRADNPMTALRRPRAPQSLPKPASEQDLATALERLDPQFRLIVMLAAFAGLRRGDIAALCREDVTESSITVRDGKGGRDAVIPTHPRIWSLVEPLPAGPLVRRRDGWPVTPRWVGSMAATRFHQIGMPHLTLHAFRHRFATVLLRDKERGGAGANLRVVQTLMRHSSPATTAIYTLVEADDLRDAMGGLR